MKRFLIVAALAAALTGCASTGGGQSPEAQIAAGANALTATATLATVLLRNEKISLDQAKSYRVLLGAASSALDTAQATLVQCRQITGSTPRTTEDPCRPQVADVIVLALNSIAGVKKTLDSK